MNDECRRAVDRHNYYRARHNAPPLVWDHSLAASAQRWANNGVFEHSDAGAQYGENLGLGHRDAEVATDSFYSEIKQYDFNNPGFSTATGHFTQVVWKGTQRIGIGIGRCNNGQRLYVFHYAPPGNVQTQFRQNVDPPNGKPLHAGPPNHLSGMCGLGPAAGGYRLHANRDSYGNDYDGCGPTWPPKCDKLQAVREIAGRASDRGAAAFNSIGCIKYAVNRSLSDVSRNPGWYGPGAGLYVQDMAVPMGWLFLPDTDSFGQDITQYKGDDVFEAARIAERNNAVAFNTWGYIKHSLDKIRPTECESMGGMRGLFVRI